MAPWQEDDEEDRLPLPAVLSRFEWCCNGAESLWSTALGAENLRELRRSDEDGSTTGFAPLVDSGSTQVSNA